MSPGEWLRKACHMAAFGPALLLPWLRPAQAIGMAVAMVLMNAFLLPRFLPGIYRPGDPGKGALEVILYPVAVLAALAAYAAPVPHATASAAGKHAWYLVPALAWFALAFSDAWAGIGCRLFRRGPALPWNPRKSLAGTAFGLLGAGITLALLSCLLSAAGWPGWPGRPGTPGMPAAGDILPVLAGLLILTALLETLWFGITDNLVLPFAVCVAFPLLPTPFFPAGHLPQATWLLLVVPAAFGILANLLGMLTLGGALLGSLMALALMAAHPGLFIFLGGFFALAVAATRWRFQGKAARHIAEGRDGKRGAAQVFGAMGAAVWMTPLAHPAVPGALLVCAAPFVAKVMDTVSSELGKAIGGPTWSLLSWRRVPPGAEGGVSVAGTLGGLAAAALLASSVLFLGWGGPAEAATLVGIALLANVFESLWGEWAARRGMENGPHTNFLMTLAAALLAWVVWIG